MCLKEFSKNAASVYDGYKKQNPLLMRKKLSIRDTVYRKDEPERELFRFELSWDTEWYVLLGVLVCLILFAAYKMSKCFH